MKSYFCFVGILIVLIAGCKKDQGENTDPGIDPPLTGKSERIYGPRTAELFGYAVALSDDGLTAIVGANSGNVDMLGHAYVYVKANNTWTLQATLQGTSVMLLPDALTGQGIAVDISGNGNTVIFGSEGSDVFGTSAFIFSRTGTTWTQEYTITGDSLELSCEINNVIISNDGNTAVVKGYNIYHRGKVMVYKKNAGTWALSSTITIEPTSNLVNTGSLAISGDGTVLAIGKRFPRGSVANADYDGKVDIYRWSPVSGSWQKKAENLEPVSSNDKYYFGRSISLADNGNTLVVGTLGEDRAGGAYVYKGTLDTWANYNGKLSADINSSLYNDIGGSVTISGNGNEIALSGNLKEAETVTGGRKNLIFCYRNENNTWTKQGDYIIDNVDGPENGDLYFGYHLSFSNSGNTLLAGNAGPFKGGRQGCIRFFYR